MATVNTIKARLRIARKTEAEWIASDPIALKDEWMVTSDGDSLKLKIGDGVKKWSELSYIDLGSGSPASNGGGYGTCDTVTETVAKVVTLADYALVTGGICAIKFTNSVPNSATLNVNGEGAKPIYYHNAALIDDVIASGDTVTFIYDGAKYHILSIDKMVKVTQTVENSTESVPTGDAVMAYTTKQINAAVDESLGNYYTKNEIDRLLANIQPASGDYSLMGIADLATVSTIKNHNLGATEIMNISLENIMDGMIDDITNS